MPETVAILGASDNPERYAFAAMEMLLKHGHNIELVNPRLTQIDEFECHESLSDLSAKPDTIAVYVAPNILANLVPEMIAAKPKRVIFNPGTEDEGIIAQLKDQGIVTQKACTLVLLCTNQFDDY